jgi:hypothetical protein
VDDDGGALFVRFRHHSPVHHPALCPGSRICAHIVSCYLYDSVAYLSALFNTFFGSPLESARTMVSDEYFDDDGFVHYIPTTVDADYLLLVVTTLFCILSNAILPCLVSLGSRYEKRKLAQGASEIKDESLDATSEQPQPAKDKMHGALEINDNNRKSEGDQYTDSHGGGSSSKGGVGTDAPGHTWRSLLDQVRLNSKVPPCMKYFVASCCQLQTLESPSSGVLHFLSQIMTPPYPDEGQSAIGGSAFVGERRPLVSDATGAEDTRSALTHVTGVSVASSNFWSTNVLDAGLGARNRTRVVRRQRRVLGDKELRRQDLKAELEADRKEYGLVITDADGVEHHGMSASQLVGIEAKGATSEVASKVSSHQAFGRPSGMRGRRGKRDGSSISGQSRKRGEGSALSGMSRKRGHSPQPSILSGLEDNVISPNDAADADDPGYYILPKQNVDEDQSIDLCYGKRAWWKPSILLEAFNRLVHLAEYDHEMKRIVKLCIPFSITALLGGVVESANVALVSQFIGTSAVAAFTLVHLILGLTSEFLGGILASEATLCSHAVGAGNHKLAGQYVQICALLFTMLMIPNIVLWMFFVDDVILLFGFSDELALLGFEYARIYIFHQWLIGLQIAYSGLLNVIGYENFATTMVVLEGIAGVVGTVLLVIFRETTLQEVALVHLSVGVVFFFLTVGISVCHGRMGRYLSGMIGSAAFLVS